jgi:hypothetical protein
LTARKSAKRSWKPFLTKLIFCFFLNFVNVETNHHLSKVNAYISGYFMVLNMRLQLLSIWVPY